MVQPIKDGKKMYFWQIRKFYPDHHVLTRFAVGEDLVMLERAGVPIYLADGFYEFVGLHGVDSPTFPGTDTIIITGDNLLHEVFGTYI
ncbi:MAG: hypothetical protein FWG68_03560 [Defluviitaleaceae bacterium]|nr:hypothetical protein [Defluviitaleaceae bacterium]